MNRDSMMHPLLTFAASVILVVTFVGICTAAGILLVQHGSPVLALFIAVALIGWALWWMENKA